MFGSYSCSLPKTIDKLNQYLPLWFAFSDDEFESKGQDFDSRMINACVNVLKKIENDNIFANLERSSFALNLVHIGQSIEERLELARLLNPDDVFNWYKSEMLV